MKKVMLIAGTRPEAVKLAPVYLEMLRRGTKFQPILCATGQHPDLSAETLRVFGITPEITLETMQPEQDLHGLTSALFREIGSAIKSLRPDLVMVQGDTVSAFVGGWCAFYEKIPVVHVEAGLRSGDIEHPFPEEATRRALSIITWYQMAPTQVAKENLLREGVPENRIAVTGNTAIDALYYARNKIRKSTFESERTTPEEQSAVKETVGSRKILVTGHRRENFGQGIANLCRALVEIATAFPDVEITYAVHPNPAVRIPVEKLLGNRKGIRLAPPMGYEEFVSAMMECTFLISDSGGIQEEAPALGKPVLVTRTTTERREAIECGANRLVGTETAAIVSTATELLTHPHILKKMSQAGSPYGTGTAAQKILDFLDR